MEKRKDLVFKLLLFILIITFGLTLKLSFTGFSVLESFNDSTTTADLVFREGAVGNLTVYLSLYSGINVSAAYINLTGLDEGYVNQTDGFYLDMPSFAISDIITNGSDFWILAETNVFHYNSSFDNQSDGQLLTGIGVGTGTGITTNGSDFWIADISDDAVYHFNSSWDNQTDSFDLASAGVSSVQGITTNVTISGGSLTEFWLVDDDDEVVYHLNSSGDNQTDSFDLAGAGSTFTRGITTNITSVGQVVNDFWVVDSSDYFVYHFNLSGSNQSDGFSVADAGAKSPEGITSNGSDFWVVDSSDYFVYHFAKSYPTNSSLDVGNDSVSEWNHTDVFNLVNNKTKNFASSINDYLTYCTLDIGGNCTIPFVFSSVTTGKIQYSDIRIDYNDTQAPSITLTPSTDQNNLAVGSKVSISCSSSDNIGTPTITVTVAGGGFCSGGGSCSGSYTIPDTDDKAVTCEAVDDSGNSASQSLTITTANGGSSGGGAPGGGGPPSIDIEEKIEEIEETFPLEIILDIEPIEIEDITTEVTKENIIVNLEDQVELVFSFIDGIRAKPKLDIKFSTKEVPEFEKQIVEIKYINWHYYFNILLSAILFIFIINLIRDIKIFKLF